MVLVGKEQTGTMFNIWNLHIPIIKCLSKKKIDYQFPWFYDMRCFISDHKITGTDYQFYYGVVKLKKIWIWIWQAQDYMWAEKKWTMNSTLETFCMCSSIMKTIHHVIITIIMPQLSSEKWCHHPWEGDWKLKVKILD